jgi:D-proline reductase (dithiol) PrdA
VRQTVAVRRVVFAKRTALADGVLSIDRALGRALTAPLVTAVRVDIVAPHDRHVQTDTILDVVPLAVKLEGGIGSGVTRVASGVAVVVTGTDEDGEQLGEAGNSAGYFDEQVASGAAGVPDLDDWIVRIGVTLRRGVGMERRGPLAAHVAADVVVQALREALREAPDQAVTEARRYEEPVRAGMPRVVLVKEMMGQGAMHDNLVLPREPGGVAGGRSIIDLGTLPLVLRANEMLDGALHSLCCVGPSTKETTLHYFRDPLVAVLGDDPQIDLRGVVVVGSPATQLDKSFVATRLGALVHALGVDGAIVATEGYGNNHIDFAQHLTEITKHGIPAVGVTYAGRQGALVVGNEYMVAMVEVTASPEGRAGHVLGESTARPSDARRAVAMLKTLMAGVDVLPPPSAWDPRLIQANQALVEEAARDNGGALTVAPGIRSEVPVPAIQPATLAPLGVPLRQARVALITASGATVRGQQPFDRSGDHSFREIAANTPIDSLEFVAGSYDHAEVNSDPNCMLPLDRLRDLVEAGEVGGQTAAHFGFQGGGGEAELIRTHLAPPLLARLRDLGAEGVLLTGG